MQNLPMRLWPAPGTRPTAKDYINVYHSVTRLEENLCFNSYKIIDELSTQTFPNISEKLGKSLENFPSQTSPVKTRGAVKSAANSLRWIGSKEGLAVHPLYPTAFSETFYKAFRWLIAAGQVLLHSTWEELEMWSSHPPVSSMDWRRLCWLRRHSNERWVLSGLSEPLLSYMQMVTEIVVPTVCTLCVLIAAVLLLLLLGRRHWDGLRPWQRNRPPSAVGFMCMSGSLIYFLPLPLFCFVLGPMTWKI